MTARVRVSVGSYSHSNLQVATPSWGGHLQFQFALTGEVRLRVAQLLVVCAGQRKDRAV